MCLPSREDVEAYLDEIVAAMMGCVDRGLRMKGELPGGLKVRRRAKSIIGQLEAVGRSNVRSPHEIMDWVSLYAIAVNEENAAGGRVVTAPTNGNSVSCTPASDRTPFTSSQYPVLSAARARSNRRASQLGHCTPL
jgi:L-serine deaminase